ncbi:MAG: CCA tRNA nucleotidyltransferase [Clostridia bacterium]|nr:CCA tRNA nucleotidyltransferase [Clostridia bacterium]
MHIPAPIAYILQKLAAAGYEGYLVGGCVRDFLLGKEPSDFDITTSALPEETMAVFAADRVIPTGLQHGTVTVLHDGMAAEITTYRTETTYADGRHPDSVSFSRDLGDDLCRRDFTVNAMAMDAAGNIVDLYGGRADLDAKIIRAVGDPTLRFTEDALRILRAFRFAAKLGFTIEKNTLDAAITLAPRLTLVSRERVFAELEKLLCGASAGEILSIMADGGVFEHIFEKPQINTAALRYIDSLPPRADIRLAALLDGDPHADMHIASLKTSAHFADSVKAILACELPNTSELPALRRVIFTSGKQAALDRAQIEQDPALYEALSALIENESCFTFADLAIGGGDVIAATNLRGKAVGEALQSLLFAVFDEKVANLREDLMDYLLKS